ncbi:hypothetical protein [Streptomyces sp. NPDC002785]|uniref:hypothetical protein n=1 Tax=Streptomyces sp. NPDC002785 TaxID=3154543 RepID=UPI0033284D07
MYSLELHKLYETELQRRAERERLVGEVRRARRAARREARDSVRKGGRGAAGYGPEPVRPRRVVVV